MYAVVFGARAGELASGEAADTLLAAPVAVVALVFGVAGGVAAAVLAAFVFAAGERVDAGEWSVDLALLRAGAFAALGGVVAGASGLLERHRSRFAGAFDSAPNGMLLTDPAGRIAVANQAAARLLGRDPGELAGLTLSGLSHPDDAELDEVSWQDFRDGRIERYSLERRLMADDGSPVPVIMSVARMPSRGERTPVIVHLVDVTQQRRTEERLAYLADHDALTGLYNRRRFEQELAEHLARARRHSPVGGVLLLDLDHFKYVNDTLGHAAGDVVLGAVGRALSRRVRAEDVLARLGGDEFAVLLPDASDEAELLVAAQGILDALSGVSVPASSVSGRSVVHVTASVGAALVAPDDEVDRLLTAADLAMYEAKEARPGRAVVHRPLGTHERQVRAGFAWGERIRQALQDGQFELYLQPIAPLRPDGAVQYEALLRLVTPERVWNPDAFLAHAERLGLIADIDRYVIDHAVRLLADIPAARRPRLEVNLSGAALGDADLPDWIDQALQRYALPAHHLIFEVTETLAIANLPLASASIRRLRGRGCGFALDDFGVGLSSFYYLRELPFDILKIDGEFIRDLPTSRTNQLIVRAMIDTAHGLGKTTVAEFVETAEIAQALRELGCHYAQGHYVGRPRPAGEISAALRRG